jgi:hypothetical protein
LPDALQIYTVEVVSRTGDELQWPLHVFGTAEGAGGAAGEGAGERARLTGGGRRGWRRWTGRARAISEEKAFSGLIRFENGKKCETHFHNGK